MLNAVDLLRDAAGLRDSVRLVDAILRAGHLMRASDVHFDPMREGVRVRFRIDGMLEEVFMIDPALAAAVTSRLKVLASLDIAERRAPQDGAFTWRMPAGALKLDPLDVRMATLPVRHGERITLRLLETLSRRLGLEELGMQEKDRSQFERLLRHPQGLVLLAGPTGSGKTTTLYAAINRLLEISPKNILTVEDPVEYEIPGVAQVEVDSSDKVNFAKALKSLLRHDPDVVMIGEIRDAASLDAAVKASLTGHLVLSTLHANSAKGVFTRLVDMGLDRPLAAATLQLAVAQRLVRRLCPACGREQERGAAARGCKECAGRGYSGRVGIFELYSPVTGYESSMAEDAKSKVAAGVTSEAEIIRVMGED
jgi:type II secretory ATPase GspE/PulE/Tfp pilus assembly ATPase PilB-like protein